MNNVYKWVTINVVSNEIKKWHTSGPQTTTSIRVAFMFGNFTIAFSKENWWGGVV